MVSEEEDTRECKTRRGRVYVLLRDLPANEARPGDETAGNDLSSSGAV